MKQGETASNIALLAPVPLVHLISGCTTAENEGKVAFGSRAWEVFRQLDNERKDLPVDVYIYASHSDDRRAVASWRARYVRKVETSTGVYPDDPRYRPPSTANDDQDHFALYWEVEDLHRLPDHEHIGLTNFTGYGKKRAYGRDFVPEGPLLVEHP